MNEHDLGGATRGSCPSLPISYEGVLPSYGTLTRRRLGDPRAAPPQVRQREGRDKKHPKYIAERRGKKDTEIALRRDILKTGLAAASLAAIPFKSAQAAYPERTIKVVVPRKVLPTQRAPASLA